MSEGISSVHSILGYFSKFAFDANLFVYFEWAELTIIRNLLISTFLVAK
jgi:hypothetical protein